MDLKTPELLEPRAPDLIVDLSAQVLETLQSALDGTREQVRRDFEHLLKRVRDLFGAKGAPGSDLRRTQTLLSDVLFSRLRRGFRQFLRTSENGSKDDVVNVVMGSVLAGTALAELAAVLDRVMMERAGPTAFDFAGRADFISLVEVFQLLSAGMHTGRLTLEKPDNRLEVYVVEGHVAFVNPRRMIRRTLSGPGFLAVREINSRVIDEMQTRCASDGTAMFMALLQNGYLKPQTFITEARTLAGELLYEFLCESEQCAFAYRAHTDVPEYVRQYDLRLMVTPLLLEGHKRMDDWRQLRRGFPDLDESIQPVADMYGRISSLNLDVTQIKLLAFINGDNSIHDIVEASGLPALDVCQCLAQLARFGVVVPPNGLESLPAEHLTMPSKPSKSDPAPGPSTPQQSIAGALENLFKD